jgi:hypothetical protein
MNEARLRKQEVNVYMGGKLNSILEGVAEPVDVSDNLAGIGILPCIEIIDVFRSLRK